MIPLPMQILILGCVFLASCAQKREQIVSDWLYSAGDVIDYKGIRTEDRKNKVKSEMDR